jgi:predicted  nucleic acid-binding Zn-ribbon protein
MAKQDTATPTTTRPRKTPQQKAQAALDKANRDNEKAVARLQKAQGEVAAAEAEVQRTQRQVDYVSRNPDLDGAQDAPQPDVEV